jgi:hypothetical protein
LKHAGAIVTLQTQADATAMSFDGDSYRLRPLLRDELMDPSRWRAFEQHGRWMFNDGGVTGEWLCDSPSLFFDTKIDRDYVWQVRVTRLPTDAAFLQRFNAYKHAANAIDQPERKYNFNFWLRADVPETQAGAIGESSHPCSSDAKNEKHTGQKTDPWHPSRTEFFHEYPTRLGTGWNGMGDDHWSSLFQTIVWNPASNWTRLRKSPGYQAVVDVADAVPFMPYDEPRTFIFAVSAARGLVRMYCDGRRVYQYADASVPRAGFIGLCIWLCRVRFDQMALYEWR